jgi:hypothetical protein
MEAVMEKSLASILVASFALVAGSAAHAAPVPKVTICHFPPGNPANAQVITVGAPAVPAHVANHHDAVCAAGDSDCCFGGQNPSLCTDFETDGNNCGECGNVCAAGETCTGGTCVAPCTGGTTLCGGVCVDENTDPDNCGGCGIACATDDTCVGGTCVPPAVAASCLPTSSLSVLIQPPAVTAYVPLGSWTEPIPGVKVVPLEPAAGPSTVVPTGVVNSCSSNGVTGLTVCTGNLNDVYVVNGTTLMPMLLAGATGPQFFSGGFCLTCGVATDAGTGLSWIAEGISSGGGALQSLEPSASTFGVPLGLFGEQTSENVSVDPVRHLILSGIEDGNFQIINTMTRAVYNSTVNFGLELDSTAEDCSTGIALAPGEFSQKLVLANLTGATYTSGVPGTWSAPTMTQDFSPDFANLAAGASGIAVAPGAHLAIVTGEFGGAGFGAIQLPSSISTSGTPSAVDWVAASVPNDPSGAAWSMGLDPHTVTAYVSPSSGKAIGLMANASRTFLALVDLQALLGASRTPGTHTVDSSVDLVATGIVTFVAE